MRESSVLLKDKAEDSFVERESDLPGASTARTLPQDDELARSGVE